MDEFDITKPETHKPQHKLLESVGNPGSFVTIDAVQDHITKHIGEIAIVWDEIVSHDIHVDLYVVNPTEERNYFTVVTSGMSDAPMSVPENCKGFEYGELLIHLPPNWPCTQEDLKDLCNFYPFRTLTQLARYPLENATWLSVGHTVPVGDAIPQGCDIKFSHDILVPPYLLPEDFCTLETSDGRRIYFYSVVSIYQDEKEYGRAHGLGFPELDSGLAAVFLEDESEDDIMDLYVFNPKRRSVISGR